MKRSGGRCGNCSIGRSRRACAERCEPYDPYAFERDVNTFMADAPDPIDGAEPIEGNESRFEAWRAMGESTDR